MGYGKYDSSDVPMKLEDIREDAKRYKDRIIKLRVTRGQVPCHVMTEVRLLTTHQIIK